MRETWKEAEAEEAEVLEAEARERALALQIWLLAAWDALIAKDQE